MFCYRRFGHNENDEPAFTQAFDVQGDQGPSDHAGALRNQARSPKARSIRAISRTVIGAFNTRLDQEYDASKSHLPNHADWLDGRWSGLAVAPAGDRRGETALPVETLKSVGAALSHVPDGFHIHKTVARQLEAKAKMFETGEGFDWATGEALAFGTLLKEGVPVRPLGTGLLARHVLAAPIRPSVDQETEERYLPLNHLGGEQAPFEVVDSLLSEEAVLGFEYGYSSAEPKALVLWEAQFGDFANGAQVVIDQFIASGEMKWLRMCGLVMLLPHGYEGQGPEHSSARLERYLQLCAQDNIQVCYPTTPANYFHVLRRQIHRPFRKPLILMTPKSLLRHKRCVSFLSDMTPGFVVPSRLARSGGSCAGRHDGETG